MKIVWPARLRKFQFSLPMLFVLVTLSAVGVDYSRRRAAMLKTERWHLLHGLSSIFRAQDAVPRLKRLVTPEHRAEERRWRAESEYHLRLADKYRRAAWFPWIPVDEESHTCKFYVADNP